MGGLFDALMGQTDFTAGAPTVNTAAGTRALNQQRNMLQQQNTAQQYSLMASGGGGPGAARAAQRNAALGNAGISGQTLAAQQQMEQNAAQQNAQMQMQATGINAGIAQQNAAGMQRGLGAAAGAIGGAMIGGPAGAKIGGDFGSSMASDFTAKEKIREIDKAVAPTYAALGVAPSARYPDVGTARYPDVPAHAQPAAAPHQESLDAAIARYAQQRSPAYSHPQGAAPQPGTYQSQQLAPYAPQPGESLDSAITRRAHEMSNPGVQAQLDARAAQTNHADQLMMADAADKGPSALQMLGVTPEQGAAAQRYRDAYGPRQAPGNGSWDSVQGSVPEAQQYAPTHAPAAPLYQGGTMPSDAASKTAIHVLSRELAKKSDQLAAQTGAPVAIPTGGGDAHVSLPPQQVVGTAAPSAAPVDTAAYQSAQARAGVPVHLAPYQAPMPQQTLGQRTSYLTREMPSDIRAKEMVRPMSPEQAHRALSPITAVEYQYKPEAAARMAAETGRTPKEQAAVYADKRAPRAGIIAQQVAKSPAYSDSVVGTPAGLAIDRDRALSTTMAAAAGLEERQSELEQKIAEMARRKGGRR